MLRFLLIYTPCYTHTFLYLVHDISRSFVVTAHIISHCPSLVNISAGKLHYVFHELNRNDENTATCLILVPITNGAGVVSFSHINVTSVVILSCAKQQLFIFVSITKTGFHFCKAYKNRW